MVPTPGSGEVAHGTWTSYHPSMSITSILRAIRRKLTPPGSRGSLDTEYRQPNGPSGIIGTGSGAGENLHDLHR